MLSSTKITAVERHRVISFIPMFVASAVFWSLFQQQFTVVAVYADKRLDRTLFGWTMPPSWVQSINPIFIIVLAGVFAAMWTRLGPRQPSTPIKFSLGTVFMGSRSCCSCPLPAGGGTARRCGGWP
jgi:POT family proton-dependent oligopeptide transporter